MKINSMCLFGSTFFVVAFFLSAQQVSATEEVGRSNASKATATQSSKFEFPSFPALRYSTIDCRESLQRESTSHQSIEGQLVKLALMEGQESRKESLFRLLFHYGVLTHGQFELSLWNSLIELGMNRPGAFEEDKDPAVVPLIRSKKEFKAQLEVFERLRDLAIANEAEGDSPEYFEVANKIWTKVIDGAKRYPNIQDQGVVKILRAMGSENFGIAIRPMVTRILANAADRKAVWIEASLMANTISSNPSWIMFPLKWIRDRALKVVVAKLERPESSMNFGFGESIFSLRQFFGPERRTPPLHFIMSLDQVCAAEDICKLGPAEIASLGDVQVRNVIERVNSYNPDSIARERNRLIIELSYWAHLRQEVAEALIYLLDNTQKADASTTAHGILIYKLLNYKWKLEKLSAQTPEVEEGSFVDDSGLSDLDVLQKRISTMLAQIAVLVEAILKAERKSRQESELLGFLYNKLNEHRGQLMDASETAQRLNKTKMEWSNKISLKAKQELQILKDQIMPLIFGNADVTALTNLPQSAALQKLKADPKNVRLQLEVAKEYFLDFSLMELRD